MAQTLETQATATIHQGRPLTFAMTCQGTNNRALYVITVANSGPDSVTYNGVSLTVVASNNTGFLTQLWFLANPPTGEHNIVCEHNNVFTAIVHAFCLSDSAQTNSIGASSGANFSGGKSASITTTEDNSFVVSGIMSAAAITATSGGTVLCNTNANNYRYGAALGDIIASASTNKTHSYTTSGMCNMFIAEILEDTTVTPTGSSNFFQLF